MGLPEWFLLSLPIDVTFSQIFKTTFQCTLCLQFTLSFDTLFLVLFFFVFPLQFTTRLGYVSFIVKMVYLVLLFSVPWHSFNLVFFLHCYHTLALSYFIFFLTFSSYSVHYFTHTHPLCSFILLSLRFHLLLDRYLFLRFSW